MSYGLADVVVRLGAHTALNAINLEVPPAAITAVVGGDGAGKTTALRTLVGLITPQSGVVRRAARHELGYLPARAGSYADLTVAENLAFVAAAFGISRRELASRTEPLLERTGLTEAIDRLAGKLSGGMARKLALALALLPQPRLLVLDEPTTGIDPVSRGELWRLIASAAADGAAVVLSTTYLGEAQRAAHVLVLQDGAELVSGSPEAVVEATPGRLGRARRRPPEVECWRRGSDWRVWSPAGALPAEVTAIAPDLEDAVTIAALAAERRRAVAA